MRIIIGLLAWLPAALAMAAAAPGIEAPGAAAPRSTPLNLRGIDVLATGNEWIALPDIRAGDGAMTTFNVLSMRDRGLLQASGEGSRPVLEPYVLIDAKRLPLTALSWSLLEYWIPQARQTGDGLEISLTYCAPNGY